MKHSDDDASIPGVRVSIGQAAAQLLTVPPQAGGHTIQGYAAGASIVCDSTTVPHTITLLGISTTVWAVEAKVGTWT